MILYPDLKQFKQDIIPHCKAGVDIADKLSEVISLTYEQLLPKEIPQDTVLLLHNVRNSINNIKHNLQYILSSVSIIGADQRERYFAVKDGEFQEVTKEEYPEDDDTSTAPEV